MRFNTATLEQLAVAYQESQYEPIGNDVFHHLAERLQKLVRREVIHRPWYCAEDDYRQDVYIVIWQCALGYSPLAGDFMPYVTTALEKYRFSGKACRPFARFRLLSSEGFMDSLDRVIHNSDEIRLKDVLADASPDVGANIAGWELARQIRSELNDRQNLVFGMMLENNGRPDIGGMAERLEISPKSARQFIWRLKGRLQGIYSRLEAS